MEDIINKNKQPINEFGIVEIIKGINKIYRILLSKWVTFIVVGILGMVIGLVSALFTKTTYTTYVSFVLEEGKASGGGLSAIAGQFGLDLGGLGGSSSMLSGDNIVGLLTSKRIVESVLLSSYDSNGKRSLADVYSEVHGLKKKWKKKFPNIQFPVQESRIGYTKIQDSLLQIIEETVLKKRMTAERKDKKMTFIVVNATMADEQLCTLFSDRMVKEAVDFYIETKTRRSRSNVARLEKMADSILRIVNGNTYSAATMQSQSLDVNPMYGDALVGTEISGRNKLIMNTVYAEIMKNLLVQKATLTQETPVIQVVDSAQLSIKKNKTSKLISMIVCGFVAVILVSIFIIIRYWWKSQKYKIQLQKEMGTKLMEA